MDKNLKKRIEITFWILLITFAVVALGVIFDLTSLILLIVTGFSVVYLAWQIAGLLL